MISLSEQESAKNGRIRVGAPSATATRAVLIEPAISGTSVDPDSETTAPYQSSVILLPVADAVLGLVLFGHALRLADVPPPQLFVQQRLDDI